MTDKELHKLRRVELLEVLVKLADENETIKKENEQLKQDLADCRLQAQSPDPVSTAECEALRKENARLRKEFSGQAAMTKEVGSIAEAAVQISGVFAAAQRAADIYLANVRRISGTASPEDSPEEVAVDREPPGKPQAPRQNVPRKTKKKRKMRG